MEFDPIEQAVDETVSKSTTGESGLTYDPVAQAVENVIRDQAANSAKAIDPKVAAKAQVFKSDFGMPEQAAIGAAQAKQDPDELRREEYIRQQLPKEAPATAARMAQDPLFAAMSREDIENIGTIEKLSRNLTAGAIDTVGLTIRGIGELSRIAHETFGTGDPRAVEKFARVSNEVADRLKETSQQIGVGDDFVSDVERGLGQLPVQIATCLNPVSCLGSLGAQGAGQMAEITANDPNQKNRDEAIAAGAALTAITERIGLGPIMRRIPTEGFGWKPTVGRIGVAAATEGVTEGVENIGQDVIRSMTTAPGQQVDFGQAMYEGGVGATVGAIARAVFEGAFRLRRMSKAHIEQSAQENANIREMVKTAANTKMAKEAPKAFKQHIEETVDKQVRAIYIKPEALEQAYAQKNIDLPTEKPEIAARIEEAKALGADVRMKPSEVIEEYQQGNIDDGTLMYAKVRPEAVAPAEVDQAVAETEQEIQQAVEEAAQQVKQAATEDQQVNEIAQQVAQQVQEVAGFRREVAHNYGLLVGEYYRATAQRLNMEPTELWKKKPLRVADMQALNEIVNAEDAINIAVNDELGRNLDYQIAKAQQEALKAALDGVAEVKRTSPSTAEIIYPDGANVPVDLPENMPLEQAYADASDKLSQIENETRQRVLKEKFPAYFQTGYTEGPVYRPGQGIQPPITETPYGPYVRLKRSRAAVGNSEMPAFNALSEDERQQVLDLWKNGNVLEISARYGDDLVEELRTGNVYEVFVPDTVPRLTRTTEIDHPDYTTVGDLMDAIRRGEAPEIDLRHVLVRQDAVLLDDNGDILAVPGKHAFVQSVGGVQSPDLYVFHHIREDGVALAHEMGGLPSPSIGVASAEFGDSNIGFGEITLLAKPDMIEGERVFAGDIWSARMPTIQFEVNDEVLDGLTDGDYPYYEKTVSRDSVYAFAGAQLAFLKQKGLFDWKTYVPDVPEYLKSHVKADRRYTEDDYIRIGRAALEHDLQRLENKEKKSPFIKQAIDIYRQKLKDKEELLNEGKALVWRYGLESKKALPDHKVSEIFYDHLRKDDTLREDYEKFVNDVFNAARGKAFFIDPNSGRKKAATAKNMMRAMRTAVKNDPRGQESVTAPGTVFFTPEVDPAAQRQYLQSMGDRALNERISDIIDQLGFLDTSIESFFEQLASDPERVIAQADVDRATAERLVQDAIHLLQLRPTPYMEAKPARVVDLSEFEVALVPQGADEKVKRILRGYGLEVREYVDKIDRNYQVQQARGLLFQQDQHIRGAFAPAANMIGLSRHADLSTFLHEAGHAFLEMHMEHAAVLDQEAGIFGINALKPGEQGLLRDMQTVLKWFGLKDFNEWASLPVEERRAYHEKFAESFEQYLLEGKAPSLQLVKPFAKFRGWLLGIYRTIKSFLQTHPNANINDDIRRVMDRMLATDQAIEEVRAIGDYTAMLEAAQDNNLFDPKTFARLVGMNDDAMEEAIAELTAKSVKALRITDSKIAKRVKELEAEARAVKRQAYWEAHREVMSQPIYRVWQFLTAKRGNIARHIPLKKKPKDKGIDPTRDDLLTAIAKEGGLNVIEWDEAYGLNPKDYGNPRPIFGPPVFRRADGLAPDHMAEALAQFGYLDLDEHGKWDLNEFVEKVRDALMKWPKGERVYGNWWTPELEDVAEDYGAEIDIEGFDGARLDWWGATELLMPHPEVYNTAPYIEALEKRGMLAGRTRRGVSPAAIAVQFGYDDPAQMLYELATVEPPKEAIKRRAEQIMLEKYSEYGTPEALRQRAIEELHNEARGRFLAAFMQSLNKAARVDAKKLRAAARQKVRNTPMADLKPYVFLRTEAKAARRVKEFIRRNDIKAATGAARVTLLNNLLYSEAVKAEKDVQAALRYLKKFDRKKAYPGIDPDYFAQIKATLADYDLVKNITEKELKRRKSLRAWYEEQVRQGYTPDIDPAILDRAGKISWRELTPDELLALADAIKAIEHLGRTKEKLRVLARNRRYEEVRDRMVESIKEVAEKAGRKKETRLSPTHPLGRFAQGLKEFGIDHLRASAIAEMLDGGELGVVWETLIAPANERAAWEAEEIHRATVTLARLMKPFTDERLSRKRYWESIGMELTREQEIAIALNWGNEGNRQRLLDGFGWTEAQVRPILESLTQEQWHAIQAVWDFIDSYWPQIEEQEKRIYGYAPEKVKATPFTVTTADGVTIEMRGGYYPVKYDPEASERAEQQQDAEKALQELTGAYYNPTPRRTFAKERVEKVVERPLLLSLSVLTGGVHDVIHSLAWHEYLLEANRLLKSKQVNEAIRAYYGAEYVRNLKDWLKAIAAGREVAENSIEKIALAMRRNVSLAALGFNMHTAALQLTGFANSAERVGWKWIMKALATYMKNPSGVNKFATANSQLMHSRAITRFRDLAELRGELDPKAGIIDWLKWHAYDPIVFVQTIVDRVTFLAAYEKALAEGKTHEQAVKVSEQMVIDAQGSGLVSDLARVERKGFARYMTAFQTFFLSVFNRIFVVWKTPHMSVVEKTIRTLQVGALPALLAVLLDMMLGRVDCEAEDVECIAKHAGAEGVKFYMNMFVYVRELSAVADTFAGLDSYDYRGPAFFSVVPTLLNLAQQVKQGEADEAAVRAAMKAVAYGLGLPLMPAMRFTEAAMENSDDPLEYLFGVQKNK